MKQTPEVMTHHGGVLATLLKQKSGNGHLHQQVLIPLGVLFNESHHGVVQILRQLIFHTDVGGHRIRGLVQLGPFTVNTSIRPCRPTHCQKTAFHLRATHWLQQSSVDKGFG